MSFDFAKNFRKRQTPDSDARGKKNKGAILRTFGKGAKKQKGPSRQSRGSY